MTTDQPTQAKISLEETKEIVRQAIRDKGIKLSWVSSDEITRLALEVMVAQDKNT